MLRAWLILGTIISVMGTSALAIDPVKVKCSGDLGEFSVRLIPSGKDYGVEISGNVTVIASALLANEALEYWFLSRAVPIEADKPTVVATVSHSMLRRYPIFSIFSPAEAQWMSGDEEVKSSVCRFPSP